MSIAESSHISVFSFNRLKIPFIPGNYFVVIIVAGFNVQHIILTYGLLRQSAAEAEADKRKILAVSDLQRQRGNLIERCTY